MDNNSIQELIALIENNLNSDVEFEKLFERMRFSEALFENSPILFWIEDFGDARKELLKLQEELDIDIADYFAQTPNAVFHFSTKIKIIDINGAVLSTLGYLNKETLLENFSATLTEKSVKSFTEALISLAKGNQVFESITEHKTSSGEVKTFLVKAINYNEVEEEFTRILIGMVDITTQVEKEFLLKEQNSKLERVLEGTDAGTWSWNVQTGETEFNEKWAEIIGYSLDELNPHFDTWKKFTHPDDINKCLIELEKNFSREIQHYEVEFRMMHKLGYWVWVLARGKVITWDTEGKPLLMFGIHIDLTEKITAENRLRESEETYRNLLNDINAGVVVHSSDTKIILANPKACEILGIDYNEIIGKLASDNFWQLVTEQKEVLSFEDYPINLVIKKHSAITNYLIGVKNPKSENIKWLLVNGFPQFNTEGVLEKITISFLDITERKRAEDKLKYETEITEMLMLLSTKFLNVPVDEIDYAIEESLRKLGGLVNSDLITVYFFNWEKNLAELKYFYSKKAEYRERIICENFTLESVSFIEDYRKGEYFYLPNINYLDNSSFHKESLGNRGVKTLISIPLMKFGDAIGSLDLYTLNECRTFSEKEIKLLTSFSQMLINVFERRRHYEELIESRNRAEISERLKTEFLAQMSHEIRSPLNVITSFLSLIQEEIYDPNNKELEYSFNAIESSSRRIIRTIDMILNMSDLQLGKYETKIKSTDLTSIINNVIIEYKSISSLKKLDFRYSIDLKISNVETDDYSFNQIVANLVDNAIKYTKEGFVELRLYEKAGFILLDVEDSGIGISEEYLPTLFTPFSQEEQGYSRKFDGNGLGLALVKRYCDSINAEILVKSKKGVGSTFTVKLPVK